MDDLDALASTQRIVISKDRTVKVFGSESGGSNVRIVSGGPVGPRGPLGPSGPSGPQGAHGPNRFYGDGPPGTIIGSQPGDEYVDRLTGDLYTLQ